MQYITMLLGWMPPPLMALVVAALGVVAIYVIAKIVKLILDVLPLV